MPSFSCTKYRARIYPNKHTYTQNRKTQERTTLRRAQAKGGIRAKKTAQIASKHLIYPELVNECKKTGKEDAWRMLSTKYTYERNGEEDG